MSAYDGTLTIAQILTTRETIVQSATDEWGSDDATTVRIESAYDALARRDADESVDFVFDFTTGDVDEESLSDVETVALALDYYYGNAFFPFD